MLRFNFKKKNRAGIMLEADEVLMDSASVLDPADYLEQKIERPLGRASSFLFLVLVLNIYAFDFVLSDVNFSQ